MATMRKITSALPFLVVIGFAGCSDKFQVAAENDSGADGGGIDASPDVPEPPAAPATKLDILFMIDNSSSMGDKQDLLRQAIPTMLQRFVRPNCLDDGGKPVGPSDANGNCAA